MLGRWLGRDSGMVEAGVRARRQHSVWLTAAIRDPRGGVPRIPTRRVADGGFAGLLARPGGPERAERWWTLAIDRAEGVIPSSGTIEGPM